MTPPTVSIIQTGIANIASVVAGFKRTGLPLRLVSTPHEVDQAQLLVLPGVGSFGAGMEALTALGLVEPIRARIASGLPTLAVCLGLQLLCQSSEESPGIEGIGAIPARVRRLRPGAGRIPHFGWNRVEPAPDSTLLEPGYAYYANSFCVSEIPEGWSGGTTEHTQRFVGALERGPVLACQFHPELSGAWGAALLRRWIDASAATCKEPAPC